MRTLTQNEIDNISGGLERKYENAVFGAAIGFVVGVFAGVIIIQNPLGVLIGVPGAMTGAVISALF